MACRYNNKWTIKTATETEETLASLGSRFPVTHLSFRRWSHELTAVISRFLVLKLPGCGPHNSSHHQHLRPSHQIAGTSTTWIYMAMEVKKSLPFEASYWWTKTDPQYLSKSTDLATKRTAKLAACCPVYKQLLYLLRGENWTGMSDVLCKTSHPLSLSFKPLSSFNVVLSIKPCKGQITTKQNGT